MPLEKKSAPNKPSVLPILPTAHLGKSPEAVRRELAPTSSPNPTLRKVLIVEDEPSIRNVLYVLLANMGFESDVAHGGREALARISRESFDAVLLDLRCYDTSAEEVVTKIREIRPSLLGRVLVITGEVADQRTMRFIERHSLPHISRHGVMEEMRRGLRIVLGLPHE